ncbi:MAG: hypothetical protein R6W93_13580 [Candidatus Limnocylindrales bacterium]
MDQTTSADQQHLPGPAADAPFTEDLMANLSARGFEVSQGYSVLYTQQDCYDNTYPVLKNCFQANPAAPYVLPVVKSWPDEYVDPASVNAFVATEPGYSVTYRLDEREAIVIYGEMPPPARYMGLQTFAFSQAGTWELEAYEQWATTPDLPFDLQYLFSSIPPDDPDPDRIITLSSLGDVVNNAVMERQSGYPFGEMRYFITTPSASTDQAIREELQAQGVPTITSSPSGSPARTNSAPSARSGWRRTPSTSSPRSGTRSLRPITRMLRRPGARIHRSQCCACAPRDYSDLCSRTGRRPSRPERPTAKPVWQTTCRTSSTRSAPVSAAIRT